MEVADLHGQLRGFWAAQSLAGVLAGRPTRSGPSGHPSNSVILVMLWFVFSRVDHRECPFGFEFSVAKKAAVFQERPIYPQIGHLASQPGQLARSSASSASGGSSIFARSIATQRPAAPLRPRSRVRPLRSCDRYQSPDAQPRHGTSGV